MIKVSEMNEKEVCITLRNTIEHLNELLYRAGELKLNVRMGSTTVEGTEETTAHFQYSVGKISRMEYF